MNVKMFPATDKLLEAIKQLDFFVDADLFMSQTAKYADIVLRRAPRWSAANSKPTRAAMRC